MEIRRNAKLKDGDQTECQELRVLCALRRRVTETAAGVLVCTRYEILGHMISGTQIICLQQAVTAHRSSAAADDVVHRGSVADSRGIPNAGSVVVMEVVKSQSCDIRWWFPRRMRVTAALTCIFRTNLPRKQNDCCCSAAAVAPRTLRERLSRPTRTNSNTTKSAN